MTTPRLSMRDPTRQPTHPGAILREDVLPALAMTQTELAQRLGVSRLSVSEILHEKRPMRLKTKKMLRRFRVEDLENSAVDWSRFSLTRPDWITPDMAIRIGRLLGNGPGIWLRMQTALDVWQLEQRGGYEHIEPLDGEAA